MRERLLRSPKLATCAGVVLLLVLWQMLPLLSLDAGGTIPGPLEIVAQIGDDGPDLYLTNAWATLSAAAAGYLWGNLFAIALALVALTVPMVAKPIMQIGVFSYCLPIVAVGPLFAVVFEEGVARVVLAGLSVFFTTLVAVSTGLRAADRTSLDLVTAYGGGRWMLLRKVRVVASLPSVLTGLQIAAPAALLGAIIGEYIGADSGLGVLMISSQQSMQIPRTWAVALLGALIAGVVYAVLGLAGRKLLPWAGSLTAAASAPVSAGPLTAQARPAWFRAGASALAAVAGVAAVLLVWVAFLKITGVSSFIGRSPSDVLTFLTTTPTTGDDTRGDLISLAALTTRDAFLGLAFGVSGALIVAAVFAVSDVVRSMFSAIVLSLRSVPMIAMAPLIVLVAGRGVGSVVVIGGLVTFFPTLVMVLDALQRVPKDSSDLMAALGAGRWRTLVTVQLPMAVTALLASLRIAAPLAFTGALLAEWLATGQGLGYDMILSMTTARYDMLWAEVVIVTALSLLVFAGVGLLDRWAARMYAGGPVRVVETRSSVAKQEVMA
ncbi:ABC transporter permease subunit [Williamsia sp. 1135]|uniref:ABC transporter permease n=1 Tax=Williamsia sp. 1135 TaxID=1889262 RepID=UPI000A10F484|nr:ABC transporter permease subunit [Williamsia sp. 1135]ORM36542.1 hypothetical protein BFL43_06650 [Williamsia sp. 1135]